MVFIHQALNIKLSFSEAVTLIHFPHVTVDDLNTEEDSVFCCM